jgi:hypothetical protein
VKRLLFVISLTYSMTSGAQTTADLPQTLPELAAILPHLVHTQPKPFDFGPFSEAWTVALQKNPASISAAMPVLSRDLEDPDQKVQYCTLAILYGLELQPNGIEFLAPLSGQLAKAISTGGDQYTQSMALTTVAGLYTRAPDIEVTAIEKLLGSRPTSERVTLAAAGALMATRPTDDVAQTSVLAVINDTGVPSQLREQLLSATASPYVGRLIVKNIIQVVNTNRDNQMRDAGIAAAIQVGSPALSGIGNRLNQIINDPSESPASHRIAQQALNKITPGFHVE